jgi:hypothetical protein
LKNTELIIESRESFEQKEQVPQKIIILNRLTDCDLIEEDTNHIHICAQDPAKVSNVLDLVERFPQISKITITPSIHNLRWLGNIGQKAKEFLDNKGISVRSEAIRNHEYYGNRPRPIYSENIELVQSIISQNKEFSDELFSEDSKQAIIFRRYFFGEDKPSILDLTQELCLKSPAEVSYSINLTLSLIKKELLQATQPGERQIFKRNIDNKETKKINALKAKKDKDNSRAAIDREMYRARRISLFQISDEQGNLLTPSSKLHGFRELELWREIQEYVKSYGSFEMAENKLRLQYPNDNLVVDYKIYILKRHLLLDEHADKPYMPLLQMAKYLEISLDVTKKLLYEIKHELLNGLYISPIILQHYHLDRLQRINKHSLKYVHNMHDITKFEKDDIVFFNITAENTRKGIYTLVSLNPEIKSVIFDKNSFYEDFSNKEMLSFLANIEHENSMRAILINTSERNYKKIL